MSDEYVLRIGADILNVDNTAVHDRSTDRCSSRCGSWESLFSDFNLLGSHAVLRVKGDKLIIETMCRSEGSLAEPRGATHNSVKHWLHVSRRPSNHTQDLARGSLLFQRLGEFLK